MSAGGSGQSEAMRQFFGDVEMVKKNIVVIKQASKRIADISQQVHISISVVLVLVDFITVSGFRVLEGRADNDCR